MLIFDFIFLLNFLPCYIGKASANLVHLRLSKLTRDRIKSILTIAVIYTNDSLPYIKS